MSRSQPAMSASVQPRCSTSSATGCQVSIDQSVSAARSGVRPDRSGVTARTASTIRRTLLVGLVVAPLGVAAGAGVALLMAGAVVAHLRRGITGRELTAPVVVMAVAVPAAALRLATA